MASPSALPHVPHAGSPVTVPPMVGGGTMGRRVRETDWSGTPLGAYATWPQSLRSALSLVLNAKGIAALYWGAEQWLLYNDAYGEALGDRHPRAFGRPMPEVLTDIAPVLGPQVAEVLRTGEGFAIEDLPLTMRRHGRDEETVWTYSFSPVQGETGGFAGVLLLATEMTRHKAAERSEERGRTRLETALKVARLGSYEWHTSTGVVEVDARAREIFALPPDGPVRDTEVFSRMAPEDLERVRAEAMAAIGFDGTSDLGHVGRTVDIDYDILHPDGSRRSIASSGTVVQDPDGTRRMLGTFNDVTELRRAVAQLREHNETLERRVEERTQERNRIWQLSQDMLLVSDGAGVWQSVNPAWTRALGWSEAELVGRTSEWLEHPDDQARTRAEIGRLAQGVTTLAFENRFRTKAGDYRTLAWTAVPEDGQFYCVARDITDERASASAQADAERVRLALSAGAIIGTWFWDLPSDRFTVDEAFATAFGLDPALGREGIPLARIVDTVHPDDQAGLAAAIDEAIGRGGRYAHQYRVRRHDGRYRWLEANGHVEHGPDGTPLRFPGVLIDVASRRLDAALGGLTERLRTLAGSEEMALAAVETVGVALGLSRVAYGDVDEAARRIVVRPDWLAEGQHSIAGVHDFSAYGSFIEDLRRGDDVVIEDVATDPRTAGQVESFRPIEIASLVNLPLMEGGRLKVVFCLNHSRPHAWTGDELAFAKRVMDRTEVEIARRAAERELRTNEARQRHLLQRMPGFVGVLAGPDHVFEYVNDAYAAISGPRGFIGRNVREVFPEIEGQGFFELLDRVYATGEPFSARGVPVRLAGEAAERFIDHLYQPIHDDDGMVTGVFVGGYDVTEQQRMATALRDLNADLEHKVTERALARGRTWQVSPDLLVVLDAEGRFEAFNPAWTATLGWSEAELTGIAFSALVHPDDQAATQAVWLDAVERGLPALRFENRYRLKDGAWRWLAWVGVPDDGKVYCSARDVTADREQASALLQAEEALRQSQKMEAVGQLTGGVAHDFNNLLTVIKSSSDLLKRPDLAAERRNRYIAAISDTVDRAAKLTGQLLAFARRQALKPEVFSVGDSVRGLADMMGTLTGSRVRITTELPDVPCFIDADPSQFDTALVNLAVNARDAMDGEGRIHIRVVALDAIPAIRTHPVVDGPYVAVSLGDTGSGIPADILERIFEPFFTTKEVGKGTGLGLSQVFGFAKQSGGDTTVASVLGEGTTFTIYLPRVLAPEAASVAEAVPDPVDGEGLRVLVVEDNVDVGTFAVQTLSDLGFTSVLAADGTAALARLAEDADRFDIVFSDVMMPGMSGIELGQEIRRLHHDLPVVLTSGYSHVLAQNGTYGFELLHKPYSVEQLSQVLRKSASWKRRKRLLG